MTDSSAAGPARRAGSARGVKRGGAPKGGCAVTELFRALGKAHMLDILYIFTTESGPHRFVDIQERLSLSPNTLAERLKDLVNAGLVTRNDLKPVLPEIPAAA